MKSGSLRLRVTAEIWKGSCVPLHRVIGDSNSRKNESPHFPTYDFWKRCVRVVAFLSVPQLTKCGISSYALS